MIEPLTVAQMRALESRAMASGAVTGLELMERAGQGVVDAIMREWPDLAVELRTVPPCANVLAGPGNNGGDGFVIARLLALRGWEVNVFFYGNPEALPEDARTNRQRWVDQGGAVLPIALHRVRVTHPDDPPADLWIDALFGIGLTRALPRKLADIFTMIMDGRHRQHARLLAVDILSGVDSDTGAWLSDCPLEADLTVTFHAPKPGHLRGAGAGVSGKVVVVDIGL